MFTGIVEGLGHVERVARQAGGRRLVLRVPAELGEDLTRGESVAVNGVCLTVVERGAAGQVGFDLAEESLRVTTLGGLGAGDPVNLERPLRFGGRLGGHLVLGHVDGVGRVSGLVPEGAGRRLTVDVPPALRSLVIPKGSIAVDGVSLTVADLGAGDVTIAVIPHTLAATTLGVRQVGDRVNLEMDVIGKYVRALLPGGDDAREFLARRGLAVPVREGGG